MSHIKNLQNIARFNRWARTYDQGRMTPWFTQGQLKVLKALQLKPNDRLLDVGCGTGWAVVQAAGQIPAGYACGIDLSTEMIIRAKSQAVGLSNTEFRNADAEAIPYQSESFDAVISTHSFHHYSDPIRALTEMRRVLKYDGRLVILDSDRSACLWIWFWDRFLRNCEKGHVKYYTKKELFQLLLNAGFTLPILVASDHGHFRHGKIGWAVNIIHSQKQ